MKRSALFSSLARPAAHRRVALSCLIGALLMLSVACAQDTPPSAEATQPSSEAARTAPAPLTSRSAPDASSDVPAGDGPAAGGAEIQAPGAVFHLPETWRSEPPSSSMRLAQAVIPDDAGDGQLTVFYFGPGGGGGVDANLDRWIGQMEATAPPSRDRFTVDGFSVTWISVEGTLQPSTMGVGPSEAQPGSRLLGGIVEGPQGPWFFKATGPAATLEAAQDDFLAMLRSVRSPA